VLIKVLDSELEKTSLFRNDVSVGHYPIASREDDALIAVNPVGKDGSQHPGRHILYGLTEHIAIYTQDSGSYRNGAGGITIFAQNGTCRRSTRSLSERRERRMDTVFDDPIDATTSAGEADRTS
jgi:hypothetical protein